MENEILYGSDEEPQTEGLADSFARSISQLSMRSLQDRPQVMMMLRFLPVFRWRLTWRTKPRRLLQQFVANLFAMNQGNLVQQSVVVLRLLKGFSPIQG